MKFGEQNKVEHLSKSFLFYCNHDILLYTPGMEIMSQIEHVTKLTLNSNG